MIPSKRQRLQESPAELAELYKAMFPPKTVQEAETLELISKLIHYFAINDVSFQPMDFSTVKSGDLKKAGVVKKHLTLDLAKITKLSEALTRTADFEIADLHSRIKKIYSCVNMVVSSSRTPIFAYHLTERVHSQHASRMILDAILLTVTEIAFVEHRSVAILPKLGIEKEVKITNPETRSELYLSGNIDYGVFEYDNVYDYQG